MAPSRSPADACPMPEHDPTRTSIGAEPGHKEHRKPSTRLPTDASGWRSTVRYRSRGWSGSLGSTRPAMACRPLRRIGSSVTTGGAAPGCKRTVPALDHMHRFVPCSLLGRPLWHQFAAPSARVGWWSGIRLRLRHVGGRLASRMRWDKHICSGAVWLSAGGSSGLSPRTSTWIGCALFDF